MVEMSVLAVESCEDVAVICTLDNDLVTRDHVVVIGMHRLAVLFHDIVRDIDDVVDRADTVRSEASLHPLRGRTDFYVLYYSGCETRAQILVDDFDVDIIRGLLVVACLFDFRHVELKSECACGFTGDADHAVAVNAV